MQSSATHTRLTTEGLDTLEVASRAIGLDRRWVRREITTCSM
jgi:hypothetical protein